MASNPRCSSACGVSNENFFSLRIVAIPKRGFAHLSSYKLEITSTLRIAVASAVLGAGLVPRGRAQATISRHLAKVSKVHLFILQECGLGRGHGLAST